MSQCRLHSFGLGQGRVVGSCTCSNETSHTIKYGGFLHQLRTHQLLKMGSTPYLHTLLPPFHDPRDTTALCPRHLQLTHPAHCQIDKQTHQDSPTMKIETVVTAETLETLRSSKMTQSRQLIPRNEQEVRKTRSKTKPVLPTPLYVRHVISVVVKNHLRQGWITFFEDT